MANLHYNPSPYGVASVKGSAVSFGGREVGIQLETSDGNNNPQNAGPKQVQDAITTAKKKSVHGLRVAGPRVPLPHSGYQLGRSAKASRVRGPLTTRGLAGSRNTNDSPTCLSTIASRRSAPRRPTWKPRELGLHEGIGSGHCNMPFLPGLAQHPTDTVREDAMTAYYKGSRTTRSP